MKFRPTLTQRISFGFMLLVGLLLLASGLGLWFSNQVNGAVNVTQQSLTQFEQAVLLESTWGNVAGVVDRMLLTRQTGGQIETELNAQKESFANALSDLQTMATTDPELETAVLTLATIGEQLLLQVNDVTAASRSGEWARAQVIRHTEMSSLQRRFDDALQLYTDSAEQKVNDAVSRMSRMQEFLSTNWSTAAVLSFIAAGFVLFLSVRSVTQPIKQLTKQARQLATGNDAPLEPMARTDEIGELSRALAQMNERVRESYQALEARVAERTQALETSNQISRSLSTILDPERLLREVVTQIGAAFNYATTRIYLVADDRSQLIGAAGAGKNGRPLPPQQETIVVGEGIIGQAAAHNRMVQTGAEETAVQSALATPLAIGNDVLGVLFVQYQEPGGIPAENAQLLQAVSGQLAIALRNARAYKRAQALARREALVNNITQRIQTASNVNAVLQIAAQELGEVLRAKETIVHLGETPPDGYAQNGHSVDSNSTLDKA